MILHLGPGAKVRGLTSAACTWLTACIGILCGAGQWRTVTVCVSLGFFCCCSVANLRRPFVGPCSVVRATTKSAAETPPPADNV